MKADDMPVGVALVRLERIGHRATLGLWRDGWMRDLELAGDPQVRSLDSLMRLPAATVHDVLNDPALDALPSVDLEGATILAPCEGQEIWAAGVTYVRSREARMLESTSRDVYADVYVAERPELFFKAAGWRVAASDGAVGIRSDSTWDVPEPELAVLCNSAGEAVALAIGNDMSSRSIEGANPLYLPQAKVYDKSCAIGPAAVLIRNADQPLGISIQIHRDGQLAFYGRTSTSEMVRRPSDMAKTLVGAYALPVGAWLLTGTGIVPPENFTLAAGDNIEIEIEGLGRLRNEVEVISHSGATAFPTIS